MATMNTRNSTEATDMYQLDPFGLLLRKFWSILFFVIIAASLSLLYYFKAPKTFESAAKIYIEDQRPPTMSIDGDVVGDSTVEKYLEIINSNAVLMDAIESCEGEDLQSLANADDAFIYVRENLIATPSDTKSVSGVISLKFQSEEESDCQILLTSIIASFEKFITRNYENTGGDMLSTMNKLEKERTVRFAELMREIDSLMQKPFIQVIENKVYNQYEGQASKLQEELDQNASDRLKFVALRDNLIKAQANGDSVEDLLIGTIQDMNEGQLGGYTATHQAYLELKVREKQMTGEFGNDHPELQNVRQQIQMVYNMRRDQLLSALRSNNAEVDSSSGDFNSIVSSYIDNKIRFLGAHEAQLAEAIRMAKSKSLEITKDCERLSMLLAEREMMTNNNIDMRDQLQEFNAMSGFAWQDVRILDPATTAEQVYPDMAICLVAGLFLGILFGFIFGAIKEMAEKTFRSTEDVSRQLGVDVVAQIPKFITRRPKDTPYPSALGDLITLHQPQTQASESFKALRTSIFFHAKRQKDLKLLQFTSPTAGDGKSSVSANLAVVIAQSGRSVLLIDCDLRRQTQHERFGLPNNIGVTSIISGESSLKAAVQETCVKNLELLASGPPCGNPAEILTSEGYADLLQQVRKKYDFVIIDTPPVLPVTDPAIISNLVDAVYMPMRIRKGVQVKSQKAIESLAMVGCQVSGVIINGLTPKEAGGNNYGGYGYGGYSRYGAYRQATPIEATESKGRNGHTQHSSLRPIDSRN